MLLVVNYAVYLFLGNSREKGANLARAILLILQFVLPLLTLVLQMFLSRSREYMADSGAAYLMGDNKPMIKALQKISGNYAQSDFHKVIQILRVLRFIFLAQTSFLAHTQALRIAFKHY